MQLVREPLPLMLMTPSLPRRQPPPLVRNAIPARSNMSFAVILTRPNGPGLAMQGALRSCATGGGAGATRCGGTIYCACGATKSLPH
eukprot:7860334-Pyramimonas_sp.AAC.1